MHTTKLALVAALERELHPLIRTWRTRDETIDGHTHRFYEHENAVAICGGIGPGAARRAAEAAITNYNPGKIYSVGFAGALDPTLKIADLLTPAKIIDAADGSATVAEGQGTLITYHSVATPEQKAKLAASYAAQAVDMEAAAVARAAQARNIPFAAIKAISDDSTTQLPSMDRFTTADGRFQTSHFAIYAAVRPWMWPAVMRLARDSRRASITLCERLNQIISVR